MVSKWMDKLRRGSGLDSHGNAYQFPYEKEAINEIERLRAALEQIAACKGQALLGCAPTSEYPHCPEDEKRAHEYGANKAFEQCAAIAHEALKQQEQDGD